jgi:hypothetical protein
MKKIIALLATFVAVLVFSGGPASAAPDVAGTASVGGSHCPPTAC